MPMISKAVKDRFAGIQVIQHEPNLAVAKGAALLAVMEVTSDTVPGPGPEPGPEQGGDPGPEPGHDSDTKQTDAPGVVPPIKLVDQLPRSFGPGVLNEQDEYVIDNLVKKGDKVPEKADRIYYTPRENMTLIRLKVFESMSLLDMTVPCEDGTGKPGEGNPMLCDPADMVRCLGALELGLQPGTPAGSPIQVFFEVDLMGIYVRAVDMSTGHDNEVTIKFINEQDPEKSPIKGLRVVGE